MNPFACAYIFVKFTYDYLIQLNFVVQILVFQGIGAWFSHFLIFNQELELVKKKIINKLIDLFTICITCAMVKIFYQDSAKQ